MKPAFLTQAQIFVFLIWMFFTIFLINHGGRNNRIFFIVVKSGIRLILLGAIAAGILGVTGSEENKWITDAAIQLVLVLSAGVGGSYIAHANMTLRDFPNRLDGPEGPNAKVINDAKAIKDKQNNKKRTSKRGPH